MSVFADASALVKLYADEDEHQAIRRLSDITVSVLACVEVPAALWRKHRLGELDAADTQTLVAEFEADYFGTAQKAPKLTAVVTTGALLDRAARLVAAHGLRAHDAVQLATAMTVRDVDAACASFAGFDSALRQAAAAEGFTLVP